MPAPGYDIIIVGYGPVGATAANYLGAYGLRTLVLERDDTVYRLPRAGTCDDEAMRIWEAVGLAGQLMPNFLPQERIEFLDARGDRFLELKGSDFGYGFHAFILLYQPYLERVLRQGVARFPCVEVRLHHEVEETTPGEEAVTLAVRDHDAGSTYEVSGRWVIACDGGRSTLRPTIGATLEGITFQHWLVVDIKVDDPARYPGNLQFVCDPRRPSVNYPMAFGHHRFQFMLLPGEDSEAMEEPEVARRLVAPWVDLDEVELVRSAVYIYHARIADRWTGGRTFLAGDAAHLTPPFGGTGMNSGIRDACNLAWKLALVCNGQADPEILASYQRERRPHVQAMTRMSKGFSRILQTRSRLGALTRNLALRGVSRLPWVGAWVTSGEFKPTPRYAAGLFVGGADGGGRGPSGSLFPQPRVGLEGEQRRLLDEALGIGFAVLGFECEPRSVAVAGELAFWGSLGTRFVRVVAGEAPPPDAGVVTVIDEDGVLASWFRKHRVDVAVLRPDRFVFGAYPQAEAPRATADLRSSLQPSRVR